MHRETNCFIMLCSNRTEKECIERNLFGGKKNSLEYIKEIKKGDFGFLLNYNTNELIGVFIAQTEAMLNLEPKAFNGDFPAQIRVKLLGELERLKNATGIFHKIGIETIKMKISNGRIPRFSVYSSVYAEKLIAYFGSVSIIDKNLMKTIIKTTNQHDQSNSTEKVNKLTYKKL